MSVPFAPGVKVTEQAEDVPPGVTSVQLAGLKVPLAVVVKLTEPVGSKLPAEISWTVALQVLAWPTTTGDAQLTEVTVWRIATGRLKLPELPL